MLARTHRIPVPSCSLDLSPHFVNFGFPSCNFVTFVVLSFCSVPNSEMILSRQGTQLPRRFRLHPRQPPRLDHPIPRPRLPVIPRLLRALPHRQRQHQISPAHTHRSAAADLPPQAQPVRLQTPPPEAGLRPVDRVSHSPPAPDPPPHAAPSQTLTSPARDALPQSRSTPATSHPASSSAPPATTGSNAASERTLAPDTKSATPATPPPIAPTRAALHRGLSDPSPDPPSCLPTAPATPPPTAAIPLAHPASKSESLSAKTMSTRRANNRSQHRETRTPFPPRVPKAPAPRPRSAQCRHIPA